MDDAELNCVIFLDIRKAFDSINHELLFKKWRKFFGITHGIQLKWFESCLNNRAQQCLIDGQLSYPKMITCGVLEGSILSPLLFLLYINGMPYSLNYLAPSLYADDTVIYGSYNDGDDLVDKVNSDLYNIDN